MSMLFPFCVSSLFPFCRGITSTLFSLKMNLLDGVGWGVWWVGVCVGGGGLGCVGCVCGGGGVWGGGFDAIGDAMS